MQKSRKHLQRLVTEGSFCYRGNGRSPYVKQKSIGSPKLSLGSALDRSLDDDDFCDSGILVMDVIDTGEGMTTEEVARLFNPFTQANGTVKARHGGTGLGLWISRQLVQRFSGMIEVRSLPHIGSRFRVTLPLKVDHGEALSLSPTPEEHKAEVRNEGFTTLMLRAAKSASLFAISASEIRAKGKIRFTQESSSRWREKKQIAQLLVVENEQLLDDNLLGQVLSQLRDSSCELLYSTYEGVANVLRDNDCAFDAVVLIATTPDLLTKRTITTILKQVNDACTVQIPLLIASGIAIGWER